MMHAEQPKVPSRAAGLHARSNEVLYKDSVLLMQEDAKQSEVIIPAVIDLLKTQIESNDKLVLPPGKAFVTNISVTDFLGRIVKYSNASPCCYAVALMWLERQRAQKGGTEEPLMTSATYQKTILTALMCAAKFLDDLYYSNKHWAQIGGVTTAELNKNEVDFLTKMDFHLHVQREEYDVFCKDLIDRVKNSHLPPTPVLPAPAQNQNTNNSRFTVTASGPPAPAPAYMPRKVEEKVHNHQQQQQQQQASALSAEQRLQPHHPSSASRTPTTSRAPTPRRTDERLHKSGAVSDDDALSARTTPCNSVTNFESTAPKSSGSIQHHHQVHQVTLTPRQHGGFSQSGTPMSSSLQPSWGPAGKQMTPVLSSCMQTWPSAPQPYHYQGTPVMQSVMAPSWPHSFHTAPMNMGYQQAMPHPMLAGPPQTMPHQNLGHPMMFHMR